MKAGTKVPVFTLKVPAGTIERLALALSGEASWRGYGVELRDFYRRNVRHFLEVLNIVLAENVPISQDVHNDSNPAYRPLKLTKKE